MFKWFHNLFTLLSTPQEVANLTTDQVLTLLTAARNNSEAAILLLETNDVAHLNAIKEIENLNRIFDLDSGPK